MSGESACWSALPVVCAASAPATWLALTDTSTWFVTASPKILKQVDEIFQSVQSGFVVRRNLPQVFLKGDNVVLIYLATGNRETRSQFETELLERWERGL